MLTAGGIIYVLLIGLVVGLIAAAIMKNRGLGWGMSILLGMIGSIVGGFMFSLLGITEYGLLGQIIVGVIGACLVLMIAGWVRDRHPTR